VLSVNRYPLNSSPTVSASFTNLVGAPADPSTVTLVVTKPDATTVTYTGAGLTNSAVGAWSKQITVDQLGTWRYDFTGSGAVVAEQSGVFAVGPGLDVITLAEAKLALNIVGTNTTQDAELASYITAISLRLDALVGPIVKRAITNEAHDGRAASVTLRYYPVDSITSVVERQGATAYTLTPENFASTTGYDYDANLAAGIIYRRTGGLDTSWYEGRQNVLVSYVAGRFVDTASVDTRYKQAAAIFLTHLWRKEQGANPGPYAQPGAPGNVPTYGIPNVVRDLLEDQILAPVVG